MQLSLHLLTYCEYISFMDEKSINILFLPVERSY